MIYAHAYSRHVFIECRESVRHTLSPYYVTKDERWYKKTGIRIHHDAEAVAEKPGP